ncbi:unnamed protein product [Chrysodeixis includens]|uniref:Uncharacterized protein n=1 Tax=Chrysodeixis includens TaxID=689277 RepID=A0A9P0BN90_CHRIL|nr:unnamed protein product [Chrysodeixis includens]
MYQKLKRSIRNKLQYLGDHYSLQWVGYVFTPLPTPLFKRLFWLATIIASCVCSAKVLQAALDLYTTDAVSYSVETDYLEWNTPFPAMTICEQLNRARITKYLTKNNLPSSLATFSEDVSYRNQKICKSCTTCVMNKTCVHNFLDLSQGIRLKCEDLLTDCWWEKRPFKCCDRFSKIATEYGPCYVFNSRLTGNRTISINRRTGLRTFKFTATQDIAVRIHSPDEMITLASENIMSKCSNVPLMTDFDVILKAEQTISDLSVQRISPASRDCLFSHERPAFAHLWPFNIYSYGACDMYSRAMAQAEGCNCTHHFMPKLGNIPMCDIEGLACLYERKTIIDNIWTDNYHCPMACEEVSYKVLHTRCP